MSYFYGETPDNYEQKCLCILVLDTSGTEGGFMDSALLNSKYQKKLQFKSNLLQEMYSEDKKMKILNQEIRFFRETLNKLK